MAESVKIDGQRMAQRMGIATPPIGGFVGAQCLRPDLLQSIDQNSKY